MLPLTAVKLALPPRLAALFADLAKSERLAPQPNMARGLSIAPPTAESVVRILSIARAHGASVSIRDGGGPADIVLDLATHLNRIIRIDSSGGTVRVQTGTRVSAIRAAAAEHDLAFVPRLGVPGDYTVARALNEGLLRGAAGSDVAQTVLAAVIVTYGGASLRLGPLDKCGEHDRVAADGSEIELVRSVRKLRDRYVDQIEKGVVHERVIAGYDLAALRPEQHFDLAQALNGSQGTLGVVVELTCALEPAAAHRVYAIMAFTDIAAAAAHCPFVKSFGSNRVIGFESSFVDQADRAKATAFFAGLPAGQAWLIAEFRNQTREEATAAAESLAEANSRRFVPVPSTLSDEPSTGDWFEAANDFESSHFLISCDSPDLSGFIKDIVQAAHESQLQTVMYGDFSGPRIAVQLRTDAIQLERDRLFTAAAAAAVKHRGLIARTSGQGTESFELCASLFGASLARGFVEFASCFDSTGQMNPAATWAPNRALPAGSEPVVDPASDRVAQRGARGVDAIVAAAVSVGIPLLTGLFGFRFARWLRAR